MKISLISPSRDNLKYLKWSYNSVRKNGPENIEYCVASDFSSDGTVEWCKEMAAKDPNFKFIVNDGTWFGENKGEPKRMGSTLLYDRLIEEVATGDIVMVWHADMYLAPQAIENVLATIRPKTVVSMTRIEPPIHPPGAEKILQNFGTEPEEFNEDGFIRFAKAKTDHNKRSQGIFAPWAIYKDDFLAINGHDPLYAPQSREDSDIFNRFLLAGYEPIQLWNAFCYHMTCRGSRYNPKLTTIGKESDEWLAHNRRSERNFTRKWGHMVKVDNNLKPIVPHKYNVSFVASNCGYELLHLLEPWCSRIYADIPEAEIKRYLETEQPNTLYDLSKRVFHISKNPHEGDIIVSFDASKITQQLFMEFIANLSSILDQGIEEKQIYEFSIFRVAVNRIKYYEKDLIVVDKKQIKR